jgi:hypothetical protein
MSRIIIPQNRVKTARTIVPQNRTIKPINRIIDIDTTNMKAWYKSHSGVTVVNGTIPKWDDVFGGNDLLQATTSKQPILVDNQLNGYPAVRFDGSTQTLQKAFTLVQPITQVIVVKPITIASRNNYILAGGTGPFGGVSLLPASTGIYDGTSLSAATGVGTGSYMVLIIQHSGTTSFMEKNNASLIPVGNSGVTAAGGVCIASDGSGVLQSCNCDVVEVMIFTAALSANKRTAIYNALKTKYGL